MGGIKSYIWVDFGKENRVRAGRVYEPAKPSKWLDGASS